MLLSLPPRAASGPYTALEVSAGSSCASSYLIDSIWARKKHRLRSMRVIRKAEDDERVPKVDMSSVEKSADHGAAFQHKEVPKRMRRLAES